MRYIKSLVVAHAQSGMEIEDFLFKINECKNDLIRKGADEIVFHSLENSFPQEGVYTLTLQGYRYIQKG